MIDFLNESLLCIKKSMLITGSLRIFLKVLCNNFFYVFEQINGIILLQKKLFLFKKQNELTEIQKWKNDANLMLGEIIYWLIILIFIVLI